MPTTAASTATTRPPPSTAPRPSILSRGWHEVSAAARSATTRLGRVVSGHASRRTTLMYRWPTTDRSGRRVVVETPDFALSWAATGALSRAGFATAQCPGPDEHHRCPVALGEPCALVEGADVVVSLLDRSNPEADDVRCALRRVHPDVPIVIELAPLDGSGRDRARADGLRTAPTPLRASGLVAEVGASTAPA